MGSRRDTDSDSNLEAIVDDGFEQPRPRTPPVGIHVTREESRHIAENVERKARPAREQDCWRDGPAHHLQGEINAMEKRVKDVESAVSEIRLERIHDEKDRKETNERVAKDAARATTWRTVVVAGAFSLFGIVLSFALQRWSPPAQGAQLELIQKLADVAAKLDARRQQP